MNTAEVIGAELGGALVLLGLGIGYPWLWLHYAGQGVLKLARPQQSRNTAQDGPPRGPDGKFKKASAA